MTWLIRTFGRSFVWKLGVIAAVMVVGLVKSCYAQTIECSSSCTVTIVHDLQLPPLQLTTEEGALIAGAVLAVWAIGWAARMLIRTLSIDSETNHESEK